MAKIMPIITSRRASSARPAALTRGDLALVDLLLDPAARTLPRQLCEDERMSCFGQRLRSSEFPLVGQRTDEPRDLSYAATASAIACS